MAWNRRDFGPSAFAGADGGELQQLIDDFRKAGEILDGAEQVVSKGSLNIKDDWRRRWEGHPRITHVPTAIGYDLKRTSTFVESTIGPDKAMLQAPIANLIEYGSIHNTPIPGGQPALDVEEPRFIEAAAKLGEQYLMGERP